MLRMANDFFGQRGQRYDRPTTPDRLERISGWLAIILLGCTLVALWKGRGEWAMVPPLVWAHLATIVPVLALTPVMMWRRRGDRWHRWLGWIWSASMLATALLSLQLRGINRGGWSIIHILSVLAIVGVPVLIIAARRRDIARHRGQARGFVIGALLLAGFFAFPFGRLLGHWLLG